MSRMPRLDLENVEFCGRAKELKVLRTAFDEAIGNESVGPCSAFIDGPSGCGKTGLVNKFLTSIGNNNNDNVMVCKGKFVQTTSDPLSPIEEAFCQLLEQSKHMIEQDDSDEFRVNLHILEEAFPRLQRQSSDNRSDDGHASIDSKNQTSFERLRVALRNVVRTISSHGVVVLFLDDLQWAQESALSLIETPVKDSYPNRRFFFIGTHRPATDLPSLDKLEADQCVIHLSDFTKQDLSVVLSKALRCDAEEVAPLADTAYAKTRGNAFFLFQYLLILEQKGLLRYSLHTFKWEWDNQQVLVSSTNISDNVVEAVAQKIALMPDSQKKVMTMAAYLGSSHFKFDVLQHLLCKKEESAMDKANGTFQPSVASLDKSDLKDALSASVTAGLLESISPITYKFAHDRIREGAYSLVPEGPERTTIHLTIGRQLHRLIQNSLYKGDDNSRLLLQAATQLNIGSSLIQDKDERADVAELSYDAALVAIQRLSFVPATNFLHSATHLLGQDAWSSHHALMLKTQVALCRMEYCLGNLDQSIKTADEVLKSTRTESITERCDVFRIKVLCYTQQERTKEALNVSYAALEELGFPFPRRFLLVHVVKAFLKLRRIMRRKTDEELMNLPAAQNERANMAAEFGSGIVTCAVITSKPDRLLAAMISLWPTLLTLENGRFRMTAEALIGPGYLLSELGKHQGAYRFGRIAMHYAQQGLGGEHDLRATQLFYAVISHWRRPFQDGVEPCAKTLQGLWEMGSVENVTWDSYIYPFCYFVSGLRLKPLDDDNRKMRELLSDFGNQRMLGVSIPFYQMVSNLMGKAAENPVKLTGEYMNEDECVAQCLRTGNQLVLKKLNLFKMILAYLFGEYKLAHRLSLMKFPDAHGNSSSLRSHGEFFCGMAALACLGKVPRQWRCRRAASNAIELLEKWVTSGVVSSHPLLLILKAEKMSVSRKANVESTRKAFDEAIQVCAKLGVLHLNAIANERAGVFFLEQGDRSGAAVYLEIARERYVDWDAHSKVQQMDRLYRGVFDSHALESGNSKSASTNLRAKPRFGELTTDQYSTLRI